MHWSDPGRVRSARTSPPDAGTSPRSHGMAKVQRSASDTVSPTAARRLERTGRRFTAAWHAGVPLRIEDLLAKAPKAERPILFAKLLRQERDLRGPTSTPQDYHDRF